MSNPVINIENLSKRYVLGHQRDPRDGLRHALENVFRNPLHWLRDGKRNQQALREDFWALKDVSCSINQGEVVGVIGRNGAGKSTLLKILSRITEPTKGRIKITGRVASLLEVGTGFHPELTGRENVFLNGAILGMSRTEIKQKFDEIVAFSEIAKFLDTPVKRYSSGMYVRLAFAVAAHLEPEILIVDEVLAVGDAEFQKKCMGKIQDVSGRQGRTVLFVSHNMSAIRSLCQRALFLVDGKVCQDGETNLVIENYLSNLHEDTSLDIDLSQALRTGRSGSQLRIQRVRINGGAGIWHGQPLVVEFFYECLSDVDEVSLAIGFCNRDGIRILTLDSDIPGPRWKLKHGQSGVVRLSIPQLFLEPDFYTLDIGSRSGDNAGLEYLPQSARIIVMPSATTPPVIAMRESGRGGVRLPSQWEKISQ